MERAARSREIDAARLPDFLVPLLSQLKRPKLLVAYAFDLVKPQVRDFLRRRPGDVVIVGLEPSVSPQLVVAGQPATVELTVSNDARTPTGVLLLEERLPHLPPFRWRLVIPWPLNGAKIEVFELTPVAQQPG